MFDTPEKLAVAKLLRKLWLADLRWPIYQYTNEVNILFFTLEERREIYDKYPNQSILDA